MKEYDANQHGGEDENRESLVAKGFKRDWGNANGHRSGGRLRFIDSRLSCQAHSAPCRNRTCNLMIKSHLLCQLS